LCRYPEREPPKNESHNSTGVKMLWDWDWHRLDSGNPWMCVGRISAGIV